jgi:SHS2 domain-containing protein
MPHHFIDHTADLRVVLSGQSVEALFAAAAEAFTDAITPLSGVEPRRPEEISVAAPELDLLLVDFLSELLYRFDTKEWLTSRADVEIRRIDDSWTLLAALHGERLDPPRHTVKVLVKAVTYHGLQIVQGPAGWTATVVFDI